MMSAPLVTIICLCYNHGRFVRAALDSATRQTHPKIQLIIVDDASTDGSKEVISSFLKVHPGIQFISLEKNLGNCGAFNVGLRHAKGEFVIDLAGDDLVFADRVEQGLKDFSLCDESYGVQFTDAEIISEDDKLLALHSDRFPHHSVPQGDVYLDLVGRYFICGATMMIRKAVYDRLGGYDERLAYEDFDFWIRSSREFKYRYLPQVLVRRRIVSGSLSELQERRGSSQQLSTYQVCEKIMNLNRAEAERRGLQKRVAYEFRQALMRGDLQLAFKYSSLWSRNLRKRYPAT